MRILIFTLLLLMMYVPSGMAQQELVLTFEEAVEIGLERQLDYRKLLNQQQVLRMERLNAQMNYLPRLNFSNSNFRQIGQQFQQVEGELIVTNEVNSIVSGSINASMPVFNAFRQHHLTRAGKYFEEAGELGLERNRQLVYNTIAQQYLQALLSEELVRIAKENLENQRQLLSQIEGFVNVGLRTLADLYNQQSEVARLETVLLDAELDWETNRWVLAESLQLESEILPKLTPIALDVDELEWISLPLEELYENAKATRKDLQQQQEMEKGNRSLLAMSRTAYFPQLSAFFNYNTFYTSLDNRTFSNQFFNIFPQRVIGLNLNIPIFNNFDNKTQVTRAKVEYMNQQLDRSAIERVISQEVKLAYQGMKAAVKRKDATAVQLEAAEVAYEAISERFRLGVSNFVDLAQANQQLVTAQSDYAQARYTLYFQELQLKFAIGE
ncbi:TolC family protein [Belliella kenyensis]|uniref:TolC family protein n=1 Tax=Belliella kenyensis TaxID=1472724 RepID=A0ABV8EQI3_9BACT|nr:TolC family protein [Belliella kenyensis]MCH7402931.1 TolC family protein [Belliella kenyensis]MDN3602637.1 TolC family protein [Belliella kenyensis]